MKLLNVLSVAVFGAMFVVGCSDSVSTTQRDGGADTTPQQETGTGTEETGTVETGTDETGGSACTACVQEKCASVVQACRENAACKKVSDCVQTCAGADCDACFNDGTDPGVKQFEGVLECGQQNCAAECPN
jgi:hypothetical protein